MSFRAASTQHKAPIKAGKAPSVASAAALRHARWVDAQLHTCYPQAPCGLDYTHPFSLLVATILSAQCTDKRVNLVTPALFARFASPAALAQAPLDEVEQLVHSTGFFRAKARAIVQTAAILVQQHQGQVPADMQALMRLPGVARKTANVVMGLAFADPQGVVVDTHVLRLAQRLGLSQHRDPVRIEQDLMQRWPKAKWVQLSLRLISHGRAVCVAQRPRCGSCALAPRCPAATTRPQRNVSPT